MSKQLQHSPGPWAFHKHGGWYIEDAQGNVIAEVNSAYHGDGHLFEAAPHMLRILRVIASGMPELRWLSEGELRAAFEETVDLVSRLDGAE